MSHGVFRLKFDRRQQVLDRFIGLAQIKQGVAQIEFGLGKLRLEAQRRFVIRHRRLELLLLGESEPQPAPSFGEVRIGLQGRLILLPGAFRLPALRVIKPEIDMSERVFSVTASA